MSRTVKDYLHVENITATLIVANYMCYGESKENIMKKHEHIRTIISMLKEIKGTALNTITNEQEIINAAHARGRYIEEQWLSFYPNIDSAEYVFEYYEITEFDPSTGIESFISTNVTDRMRELSDHMFYKTKVLNRRSIKNLMTTTYKCTLL